MLCRLVTGELLNVLALPSLNTRVNFTIQINEKLKFGQVGGPRQDRTGEDN